MAIIQNNQLYGTIQNNQVPLGNANIGGKLVNVGPMQLINQSGIALNMAKLAQMPALWWDVDGYKERGSSHGSQEAERVFEGPWSTRFSFYQWALGYETNVAINSKPTLLRSIPAPHPTIPWLYATDYELIRAHGVWVNDPNVPLLDANGNQVPNPNDPLGRPILIPMIAYADGATGLDGIAQVRVRYEALPYEVRDDAETAFNGLTEMARYVIRSKTYALNSLPIPGHNLFWAEGDDQGKPISANSLNLITPTSEITWEWVRVPDPPWDAIKATEGRINDAPFDVPYKVSGVTVSPFGSGFDTGTLLFIAPKEDRIPRTIAGRVSFSLGYKAIYRPTGWNKFPHKSGNYFFATNDGTPNGKPFYQSASFPDLFKMPPPLNYQGPAG
jgi:hypothetical protein